MTLVLQELIELEATQAIGAGRYERTDERTTHRNGSRTRLLSTKAGDVELHIPKLREGSLLPLPARAAPAHRPGPLGGRHGGLRPRRVDPQGRRPRAALGIDAGISKSEVSRICAELDGVVGAFRERRLDHARFPYLFLDATYVKAHEGRQRRVQGHRDRHRGDRGTATARCWASRSATPRTAPSGRRSCAPCGPAASPGVRLVISDAHEGLKGAIAAVLLGAAWQRCRVHFLRNVLARIPKGSAEMVLAVIRTIFAQPDAAAVREQLDEIADKLAPRFPVVAAMLADAREDLLAFAAFPVAPLEEDLEHQPARAGQQGDQAPHRRGGHLPQRGRRPAPRGGGPARGPRRVADRRAALPRRGLHGPA